MDAHWLEAIATALSAVAIIFSAYVAYKVWTSQDNIETARRKHEDNIAKLQRDLEDKLGEQQRTLQQQEIVMRKEIADREELLAQRAQIVPLWSYLSQLREIDPERPIVPHVVHAVSTLELVALCCEGKIVDQKVINRTFRKTFIETYQEIEACRRMESLNKTGKELLNENNATVDLYNTLKAEERSRDRISTPG
jgi:hypothetical protein